MCPEDLSTKSKDPHDGANGDCKVQTFGKKEGALWLYAFCILRQWIAGHRVMHDDGQITFLSTHTYVYVLLHGRLSLTPAPARCKCVVFLTPSSMKRDFITLNAQTSSLKPPMGGSRRNFSRFDSFGRPPDGRPKLSSEGEADDIHTPIKELSLKLKGNTATSSWRDLRCPRRCSKMSQPISMRNSGIRMISQGVSDDRKERGNGVTELPVL